MTEQSLMFFFSKRQENDRITVGDGSDKDHFPVCMSSIGLLLKSDGHNQNFDRMHGVDGTYRILKRQFF